jgi:hypothetical protein
MPTCRNVFSGNSSPTSSDRSWGDPLDAALDSWLNTITAAGRRAFRAIKASCRLGVAEGWLCNREGGGIRYGRIFDQGQEGHGFSVDVVDMNDIVGPHHAHPNGEIDLIMPLDGAAFDGRGEGWLVYPGKHPQADGVRRTRPGALPEGRWDSPSRQAETRRTMAETSITSPAAGRKAPVRAPP